MLSNSFKILAVGMSLAGLVACGKGVGQKNKLAIDGLYQKEGALYISKDGKEIQGVTLAEIDKDNIRTTYKFSPDQKDVELTRDRLIVKGNQIIGTEFIEGLCDITEAGSIEQASVKKTGAGLKITEGEKENSIETTLPLVKDDKLKGLVKDVKEGKIQAGCLNSEGKVIARVESIVKEDIPEVVASESTESTEKADDSSSASEDEASIKSESSSASESQTPEHVSEEK